MKSAADVNQLIASGKLKCFPTDVSVLDDGNGNIDKIEFNTGYVMNLPTAVPLSLF